MDENKTALVKKIGEGNKSLSVIVAEEKLTKFKRFSQSINLSMGYLLNQAIDRYLANNSTEIFSTSTGIPTTIGLNIPSPDTDIEELVKTTIEAYLLNNSIGNSDVENLVNTSIANLDLRGIIAEYIPEQNKPDNLLRGEVEALGELVTELETFTRSQIDTLRTELKKPLAIAR